MQTGYDTVRTEVVVGVAYESDLDQARQVALEAVQGVDLPVLFWTAPQQAADIEPTQAGGLVPRGDGR